MAVPPQSPFQFQHVPHPSTHGVYQDPSIKPGSTPPEVSAGNSSTASGSKKQKTTPPCDRCRQRRVSFDIFWLVIAFLSPAFAHIRPKVPEMEEGDGDGN